MNKRDFHFVFNHLNILYFPSNDELLVTCTSEMHPQVVYVDFLRKTNKQTKNLEAGCQETALRPGVCLYVHVRVSRD